MILFLKSKGLVSSLRKSHVVKKAAESSYGCGIAIECLSKQGQKVFLTLFI
jgi:hypothetical protein